MTLAPPTAPPAPTPPPAPRPTPTRWHGLDLARALAILGMVIVNFRTVVAMDAVAPGWLQPVDWIQGRAAALFVVLAGVGISLMHRSGRGDGPERTALVRSTILARALVLLLAGTVFLAVWPADILHYYGGYLAIGALALRFSTRRLLGLVAAFLLAHLVLLVSLDYERGWDFSTMTYTDLWSVGGMVRNTLFNGFHPWIPWAGFLLFGMVLGRRPLGSAGERKRWVVWGLATAASVQLLSFAFIRSAQNGTDPMWTSDAVALFGVAPMPPNPLYMLAGMGLSAAIIAVCIPIAQRLGGTLPMRVMVHTGQLALTLYVAHVLVGLGTLEFMGRVEGQSVGFAVTAALIFFASSVLFAHLWRVRFARGPFEWLLRRLSAQIPIQKPPAWKP